MRQILFSSGRAVVARMPRPSVEPSTVLIRVRYSLISTGTEIAGLRPLTAGTADVGTAGKVAHLSSRAMLYLGKAVQDPRKAARRAASILRLAVARRLPEPRPTKLAPVEVGRLSWTPQVAKRCAVEDGVLDLVTDTSEAAYQAASQPIDVPPGYLVSLRLAGKVVEGAVAVGLLNADKSRWLALYTLDGGEFEETLLFDPAGTPQVTVMICNAGTRTENRLTLTTAEIALVGPDDTGLPVSEMSDQGWNVGYSVAGEVVAVGKGVDEFVPGQLVAAGGAGQANHADFVVVKRNLVCAVPPGCPPTAAATTTVGTIALQGVRRAEVQIGDVVAVVGLGLIGMITVQLLTASGCRVIGLDRDPVRAARARGEGAVAATADGAEFARLVRDMTGGHGVDRTVLTAASKSNTLVNLAMEATRRKGRVVVVGDIGLKVERTHFYRKEIDLVMSTSYGPGRYDRSYEEEGRDYPYAYVRWTQNRNMQAYLQAIADRRIDVERLIDSVVPVDEAPRTYQTLAAGQGSPPLGVLFAYPDDTRPMAEPADAPRITLRGHRAARTGRLNYALVGAGAFGQAMLVPQMDKRKDCFFLRGVVSRDTVRGGNFARSRQIEVLTTDLAAVLGDPAFQLVVIATRHDEHAAQTIAALEAGKHVFVEKPLAIDWDQLDAVRACYEALPEPPLLMIGFNRRFSPALVKLQEIIADRRSPLVVNYRLNGGYIAPDHWVQTAQGAGRNIGEACHMYDVFRALARAPVRSIAATAIDPGRLPYLRNDNFTATIGYEDGSVGNLVYTALGPKEGLPKERIEIFCDGDAYVVDDFKSLVRAGTGQTLWQAGAADKGHFEGLSRFGDALMSGGEAPIPFPEIVETTAVSLHVEDILFDRAGA